MGSITSKAKREKNQVCCVEATPNSNFDSYFFLAASTHTIDYPVFIDSALSRTCWKGTHLFT